MSVLSAEKLKKSFGAVTAAANISLSFDADTVVGLIGANGAGKTTFLNMVTGYLKPDSGRIVFDGRDIGGLSPRQIARLGVSRSFQIPQLFQTLSVRDNLRMGAWTRRDRDAAQDMEQVFAYFPILGQFAHRQAEYLSGGQQQMLAIGRALMARPKIMLLDEPSLGLSPKLVSEIGEIIVKLNREQGVTILLVEQNARMALDVADFGYVLENGRIVMEDTTARLRAATDIQEFYLGMKDQGVRGRRRWKQRKTWR